MIKTGINRLKFRPKDVIKNINNKSGKMVESVMADVFDLSKKETPIDTGQARRGWRNTTRGVVNNVEYITALEDGHSKQAPSGIAAPVIKEINKRYRKGKYNAK